MALDPVAGEGIGIAGYVRDAHDPTGAEVTYLVTDAWQHRGVGTALVERLAARAQAAGLQRFTATTLVGSDDARRLLAHVADPVREHREGGIVEITAQLRSAGPNQDLVSPATGALGSAHPAEAAPPAGFRVRIPGRCDRWVACWVGLRRASP